MSRTTRMKLVAGLVTLVIGGGAQISRADFFGSVTVGGQGPTLKLTNGTFDTGGNFAPSSISNFNNAGIFPGAANLPWQSLMTGHESARVWRSPPEIHAILRLANAEKDYPIAIYDQAGGRSAHLYFSLWLMGYDNIRNYVGGWREYGNRNDAEIEK